MTDTYRLDAIQKAILRNGVDETWRSTENVLGRTTMYDTMTAMGIALSKLYRLGFVAMRERKDGRKRVRDWQRTSAGEAAVSG